MKLSKATAAFFLSGMILSAGNLFAQAKNENSFHQVLVPRDVFIADSGVIQYSFTSPVDLFGSTEGAKTTDTIVLNLTEQDLLQDAESASIKKAELIRDGINYTLNITFVPWKTGTIKFKEFNLAKSNDVPFPVQLSTITILSLTEKLGATALRSPKSPILLPGTTYILWAMIILAIVFLVMMALVFVRLPQIIRKYRLLREKIGFMKNAKVTKKTLHSLLHKKISDTEFAEKWQKSIRKYLEYRFGTSFASVTGKQISPFICKITEGLLPEEAETSVDSLSSIFVRTNYIRFAKGSIDSKLLPKEEHDTSFMHDERRQIVEETDRIIESLEKEV